MADKPLNPGSLWRYKYDNALVKVHNTAKDYTRISEIVIFTEEPSPTLHSMPADQFRKLTYPAAEDPLLVQAEKDLRSACERAGVVVEFSLSAARLCLILPSPFGQVEVFRDGRKLGWVDRTYPGDYGGQSTCWWDGGTPAAIAARIVRVRGRLQDAADAMCPPANKEEQPCSK